MGNIIGIDLGGTSIKAGLVNPRGKIVKRCEIPTETEKGSKKVIANILSSIENVRSGKIDGIGIGSPGPMDYKKGIITNPVNLPLRNVPLRKTIQNRFRIKTYLDNDAKCFALAEAVFGSGKKYGNVLGLTLGTGIGGGLIINKRIYHGRGNATELGHTTIKYDGLRARSKNSGDVEEYISARGITRVFGGKDPYQIYKLALKGNKKAKNTFKKMGFYLGIGLANMMYSFDPEIIVIGGKISNSWQFFSGSMNREVRKRYFGKPCPVVKSALKDAGILGAAALVR